MSTSRYKDLLPHQQEWLRKMLEQQHGAPVDLDSEPGQVLLIVDDMDAHMRRLLDRVAQSEQVKRHGQVIFLSGRLPGRATVLNEAEHLMHIIPKMKVMEPTLPKAVPFHKQEGSRYKRHRWHR